MIFNVREENDSVFLETKSEILDDSVKNEFDKLLDKFLIEGKKNFHLDLAGSRFIDTAGLQMLVSAKIKVNKNAAILEIHNISPELEFSMEELRKDLLKFVSGIYPKNLPN